EFLLDPPDQIGAIDSAKERQAGVWNFPRHIESDLRSRSHEEIRGPLAQRQAERLGIVIDRAQSSAELPANRPKRSERMFAGREVESDLIQIQASAQGAV